MDTTKAQQKALDDALIAPENRLMIWKCNQRLSSTLKSNEPTIQVALDALKLTHFYNAFEVSADVLEIYMQEDMLKICPKLPGQKFEEPPFEEEILPLIRDLGHTGDIRDDSMFTTIRVISKDQDTQIYGANLPLHLTNQAMLESESYKTYHAYATGKKTPKPKKKKADSELSPKEKHAPASKGKRLKTSSKAAQSTKEKQPATKSKAKSLTVLSEVALTKDEQMKLATKRSRIQTHNSHASGSGDGVDTLSKVPDEQP
ncbi:hypothetical protein Tco_0618545 [Tanacetum coccineum]